MNKEKLIKLIVEFAQNHWTKHLNEMCYNREDSQKRFIENIQNNEDEAIWWFMCEPLLWDKEVASTFPVEVLDEDEESIVYTYEGIPFKIEYDDDQNVIDVYDVEEQVVYVPVQQWVRCTTT